MTPTQSVSSNADSETTQTIQKTDFMDSNFGTHRFKYNGIVGQSPSMVKVFELVEKVSASDTTIILNGETGTGKGMVARAIHDRSKRKQKPFVSINCGAIPENLLESELFGHVRGAFTGATTTKPGKFELANGGTIFLDEIGDMTPELQVKILRVLEEREFEPVGGCKTIKANVRIITATHRDLEEEVQKGNFREDLFYRLFVIPIQLPALRERKSDIPLLVTHFLNEFSGNEERCNIDVPDHTMQILQSYSWPGNVREIKNLVERLVVLKGEGTLTPEDLPISLRKFQATPESPCNSLKNLIKSILILFFAICQMPSSILKKAKAGDNLPGFW